MIVKAIKTARVSPGIITTAQLLDDSLENLVEGSVLAITSKVVSLCENRAVAVGQADRQQLVEQEADQYLPPHITDYGFSFTITKNTLIPSAGIDESNSNGHYVLWPENPQASANQIREYLVKRFGLKKVGVVITDSTVSPLRYGTHGVVIAHSGFLAKKNYIGQPDLFGRPLTVSVSSIAGPLAAAAVLLMGEGSEQTPLAIIEELPFVEFQDRNPTKEELNGFYIPIVKDDLFAPLLNSVDWKKGGGGKPKS